ncbi:MAG: enoyl-CoA hydratase-related protein, partial [Gemmatimonadota bacterium]
MTAFATSIENGITVVTFDLPGEPVNKLATSVAREFDEVMTRLQTDPAVRAIVLMSGKPDTFIAGADIEEFTRITSAAEAERMSAEGQAMLARLEDGAKPVIAAIHGACVGGGCELVLACHYRIATDHPRTVIGLPEVQLGILPGLGGTQRLPRLIGVRAALDIILAGKTERGRKALKLGLVDELV